MLHFEAVEQLSMPVWLTGAPLEISEDLITTFNISLVVRGTVSETSADQHDKDSEDLRYRTPKANKMFRYEVRGPYAVWRFTRKGVKLGWSCAKSLLHRRCAVVSMSCMGDLMKLW